MDSSEVKSLKDKVVSFMDEMDDAAQKGADAMQDYMKEHVMEALLAETGFIILYGDALSNKATDHDKFKICLTTGHKETIKILLQ